MEVNSFFGHSFSVPMKWTFVQLFKVILSLTSHNLEDFSAPGAAAGRMDKKIQTSSSLIRIHTRDLRLENWQKSLHPLVFA